MAYFICIPLFSSPDSTPIYSLIHKLQTDLNLKSDFILYEADVSRKSTACLQASRVIHWKEERADRHWLGMHIFLSNI